MVCAAAERLTSEALPHRAIALVEAARRTHPRVCGDALRNAAVHVEAAAFKARQAEVLLSEERWDEAEAIADDALGEDRENEKAQAVKAQARAGSKAELTVPEEWHDLWTEFREAYVDPVSGLLLPALAVLLGLLFLARLSTTLLVGWPPLGRVVRPLVLGGGLLLAATAAFWATRITTEWPSQDWPGLLLLSLVAIGLTAWGLATRLRLSVTVVGDDGKEKAAASAHVVALLSELGAEPPRGLEVPRGADSQDLEGTLKMLPSSPALKAIGSALQSLLGLTPWRIRVSEEGPDLLSVQVTRNGRSAGSAVVDRDRLRLRVPLPRAGQDGASESGHKDELPDLHRLAAAVAITTLDRYHDGFEGLCGATDWRSLGLYYIATTDLDGTDHQSETLARAVDHDPDNLLAQVAWRHSLCRDSDRPDDLRTYVEWLTENLPASGSAGRTALRQRMLLSRAAATVNYYYANGETFDVLRHAAPVTAVGSVRTSTVFAELVTELEAQDEARTTLRRAARPAAAAMALWALEKPVPAAADDPGRTLLREWMAYPAGPAGHYNLGCYYATRPVPDRERALHHLRLAAQVPSFREWLKKDPQLVDLLRSQAGAAYREQLVDPPSDDLLSLPTLKPFAQQLRDAGVADLGALRRYVSRPAELSMVVGWDGTVVEQILLTVSLADSVPPELDRFRVELCSQVIRRDLLGLIGNAGAAIPATLAAEVASAISERCVAAPTEQSIRLWLRSLRGIRAPSNA